MPLLIKTMLKGLPISTGTFKKTDVKNILPLSLKIKNMETNNITEYTNKTGFMVIAKQSNGSTYELLTGMSAKADKNTFFTAVKYPAISNKWFKLHINKIRSY